MRTVDTGSGIGGVAVTPSDATIIAPTRGIYVGVAGNVAVKLLNGTTVTFTAMVTGIIHPIRATQVLSTGTTATSIVAVY